MFSMEIFKKKPKPAATVVTASSQIPHGVTQVKPPKKTGSLNLYHGGLDVTDSESSNDDTPTHPVIASSSPSIPPTRPNTPMPPLELSSQNLGLHEGGVEENLVSDALHLSDVEDDYQHTNDDPPRYRPQP